jgi:hypothetical protein
MLRQATLSLAAALFATNALSATPSTVSGSMTVDGKVWKLSHVHAFVAGTAHQRGVMVVVSDIPLSSAEARDPDGKGELRKGAILDRKRASGMLHGMGFQLAPGLSGKGMSTYGNEVYARELGFVQIAGSDQFETRPADAGAIAGRFFTVSDVTASGKKIRYDITFQAPIEPTVDAGAPRTLEVPYGDGPILVTASLVDGDLEIMTSFANPVTSYLTDRGNLLQLEIQLDTDNNRKTGPQQEGDNRTGADFGIVVTLGMPEGKLKQNVMVGKWGQDASGAPQFAVFDAATPRLTVDRNELRVHVKASPINLRPRQTFRIAVGLYGKDLTEELLTLK